MDYIKPGLIPQGVHPATIDHHRNGMEWTFWSFHGRLHSKPFPSVGDAAAQATLFDEVLATRDFDSLPESLQELMRERWKYPPGLLSRAGYFVYNDTPSPLIDPETGWVVERPPEDCALDLYLFRYGKDFKQGLRDYRLLFGETPLIPRFGLGLWYSRYPTFYEAEIYELVAAFEAQDLPLDMFVFDLEWHKRGWHGFDWDTQHIPNPDDLLEFLRQRDIHTTFNVHPDSVPIEDSRFDRFLDEAGVECNRDAITPDFYGGLTFGGFDISVPRQAQAFMDVLHKPVQDQGVDFWWIDGAGPAEGVPDLDCQLWTNHVYHEHIRRNYPERRPMIFSREPGFGAHRYPFHFTGDTWAYWETLANQIEQTLRAGHIGQSFITHDIGAHMSSFVMIDPELYSRWVQFAVLSPVVRLHSCRMADGIGGERRPWMYGYRVLDSFKRAMELRMSLLPYLYTLARDSHVTGLPMCRSNCIEMPDWEAGYSQWTAYFLGDRIYAAPVVNPGTVREVILPPGNWYHGLTGRRIESDGVSPRTEVSPFANVPLHYYKAGTLMAKQPYCHKASAIPEALIIELYPAGTSCTDSFVLYEDDGRSQRHREGAFTQQRFTMTETGESIELEIGAMTGEYEGCPEARTFTLRPTGFIPAAAELDGAPLGIAQDGTVVTPPLDSREPHRVKLLPAGNNPVQ
jgi:alpha-glucosidase (family GH31 glycosyl hydrolase)